MSTQNLPRTASPRFGAVNGKSCRSARVSADTIDLKELMYDDQGRAYTPNGELVSKTAIQNPIKKHRCDVCGKAFRLKQYLKEHSLIHSGAKPYECKICKQRFRQHGRLSLHRKTHFANNDGQQVRHVQAANAVSAVTTVAAVTAPSRVSVANSMAASLANTAQQSQGVIINPWVKTASGECTRLVVGDENGDGQESQQIVDNEFLQNYIQARPLPVFLDQKVLPFPQSFGFAAAELRRGGLI